MIKKLISNYRTWRYKRIIKRQQFSSKSVAEIFTETFRNRYWRSKESVSGQGSELAPHIEHNEDIQTGYWRPINLGKAPFFFPKPLFLLHEAGGGAQGSYADKSLGLWEIDSLDASLDVHVGMDA